MGREDFKLDGAGNHGGTGAEEKLSVAVEAVELEEQEFLVEEQTSFLYGTNAARGGIGIDIQHGANGYRAGGGTGGGYDCVQLVLLSLVVEVVVAWAVLFGELGQ